MKKAYGYLYWLLMFIANAVGMILELAASRVLSPHFSNANSVWTAIIAVILAAGSLGNWFGGTLADKNERDLRQLISTICTAGGLFILVDYMLADALCLFIATLFDHKMVPLAATIAAFILYFAPSFCIGMLTPVAFKLETEAKPRFGKRSGRFYAIIAAGGLIGTLLGGFWLVPSFGSTQIQLMLSVVMCIIAAVSLIDAEMDQKKTNRGAIQNEEDKNMRRKRNAKQQQRRFLTAGLCVCLVISPWIHSSLHTLTHDVNKATQLMPLTIDTQYTRINIFNSINKKDNEEIRCYMSAGGYSSATYTRPEKRNDLVFEYFGLYDVVLNAYGEARDTAMLGGAAFCYPKHFIATYPDYTMDVYEIDPGAVEIAKKYFFLDELIKEYNLEENHRLSIITEDARAAMTRTDRAYDIIFNDVFSGRNPVATMTTVECLTVLHSRLKPGGVFASNIIASSDPSGTQTGYIEAQIATLKEVFRYVSAYAVVPNANSSNIMVVASDSPLDLSAMGKPINYDLSDAVILTDDYCPVEMLADPYM